MAETKLDSRDDPLENPLLTPRERELEREVRDLRERSDQLVRKSQWLNRPKEFLHRFPPSGDDAGRNPS